MNDWIVWFRELGMNDVSRVGGKNASLGEMISNLANAGIKVPDGFATTAAAYHAFVENGGLGERINGILNNLDVDNVSQLQVTGAKIRSMVMDHPLPADLEKAIRSGYDKLGGSVAVRSSATALGKAFVRLWIY